MKQKIKHVLAICVVVCTCLNLPAQQATQYTLFHFDKHLFNPAYAGIEPELTATGIFRNQWSGINGSPSYQQISINSSLIAGISGVGLNFENDQLGLEHNINASVSYSHLVRISESSIFSVGARGIWSRKILDGSKITTPDGVYESGSLPDHKDDLLPINSVNGNILSLGAGVLLKTDMFEIGLGADGILPSDYSFPGLRIKRDPTYYGNIGITRSIADNVLLSIEGLIKSNGILIQTDAVVKLSIRNNIFAGGAFRGYNNQTTDAASIFGGVRVKENITLMMAYDFGLSEIKTIHNGSIEIGLKYVYGNKIFREKLPLIIFNPRY